MTSIELLLSLKTNPTAYRSGLFLLATGARAGELDMGLWTIYNDVSILSSLKGSKPRTFFNDTLPLYFFSQNAGLQGNWMFSRRDSLEKALKRSVSAVFMAENEIRHVSTHVFRYTYIKALRSKYGLSDIKNFLGHKDIATTRGYLDNIDSYELQGSFVEISGYKEYSEFMATEGRKAGIKEWI